MQQKVMQYMMIFMGVMFYKVASGLCLYFIATSLWGLAERKFLPKTGAARRRRTSRRTDRRRNAGRGRLPTRKKTGPGGGRENRDRR